MQNIFQTVLFAVIEEKTKKGNRLIIIAYNVVNQCQNMYFFIFLIFYFSLVEKAKAITLDKTRQVS